MSPLERQYRAARATWLATPDNHYGGHQTETANVEAARERRKKTATQSANTSDRLKRPTKTGNRNEH